MTSAAGGAPARPWAAPLIVGVAAMIWALTIAVAVGFNRHAPTGEEAKIAIHLARGDGFRSPMDDASDAPASAWSAPVYPLIIAAAYRTFGVESRSALVALLFVNAICLGLVAAAMCRLGIVVLGSIWPGGAAAALVALDPLFYAGNFWDGLVALALFAWLLVMVVERAHSDGGRPVGGLVIGFVAGGLALTNASYVFTLPILGVVLTRPRRGMRKWRSTGLAVVALLAVVLPWSARNYVELGHVVMIRTGSGVQMRLGNAPISDGWLDRRAYSFHPFVNASERSRLLAIGEPEYDAAALADFAHALAASPATYAANCARRIAYLLAGNAGDDVSAPGSASLRQLGVILSGALGAIGLVAMLAAARAGVPQFLLPAILGGLALPFVASAVIDRYRLPIEFILFFYCGVGTWLVITRRRGAPHA